MMNSNLAKLRADIVTLKKTKNLMPEIANEIPLWKQMEIINSALKKEYESEWIAYWDKQLAEGLIIKEKRDEWVNSR